MAGRAREDRRGARKQACHEPEARRRDGAASRRAPPRARQGPGRDDGGPWLPQGPREAQRAGRRARAGTAKAPRSGAREGGDSPPEGKVRVVAGPGARDGSAAGMAERHGVPGTAPYLWRREMTGDSGGEPEGKGEPAGRGSDDPPDGAGVSRDVPREAKTQPGRARPQPGARRVAPGWQEKTRAPTRGRRPTRRGRRWRRR